MPAVVCLAARHFLEGQRLGALQSCWDVIRWWFRPSGHPICPTSWSFSRGIRSCVQSLLLPCSHGVLASFEAKRIMIIMIYDILRLTILSSHSLPKPGCMLVYYRFPKMPSMFHLYVKCDAQQVKPCLLFSHSPFLHIITYLQTHHDPAGKNVRTTVMVSFKLWVRFGSLVLFCSPQRKARYGCPFPQNLAFQCISVC